MCNRDAIRANVNKASKVAKRGECLPCERFVQGKRYVGKKALLARYFILLLRSQNLIWILSIFTSPKLEVWSPGMKSIKNILNINVGFGHNKTERFCSEMSIGTCSLVRLKEREQIHLGIGHLHDGVILLLRPEFFWLFFSYLNLVIPVRFT